MNTKLVIAYYTIFQKVSYSLLHHFPQKKKKQQLVIFLIKSVFCEHANKKGKNVTYCKGNSTNRSNLFFKLLLSSFKQLNGTLSLLHISCYITFTQGIIMIVLINTIFLPLCKQKIYIIAIFCIGSSSVLLVIPYFYQGFN